MYTYIKTGVSYSQFFRFPEIPMAREASSSEPSVARDYCTILGWDS